MSGKPKDWFAPSVAEQKDDAVGDWLDRNPLGLTVAALTRDLGVTYKNHPHVLPGSRQR